MEYKEIIDKIRPELDKVLRFLEGELSKIRTGRATPGLVEDLMVECYGQKFPLKQLAGIFVPQPRQIVIQPWDKSYLPSIEKALRESGMGLSPVVEKDTIRVSLPPLSEEYRKELLKILSEKMEQARITIRRWREEAWGKIQQGFREGKIREDDKYRAKDELQELIDDYNQKIEELGEKKRKEIMEG